MKVGFLLSISVLLCACIGYRLDQRVVGRFEAAAGEAVVIRTDGRIHYVTAGKEEFVGLVTIDSEKPLSIRVIAPDTSPLVGTKITFSDDNRQIAVDWSPLQRPGMSANRPTAFRAK